MTEPTRRVFLGRALAGAAAVVAFGGIDVAAPARAQARRRRRAIVMGAGLAGLTAAHDLVQSGWDVVVLEARERVGGRVETLRVPFRDGMHAEAGGESIDDNHHAILALIAEFGLRTEHRRADREANAVVYRNGRRSSAAGFVAGREGAVLADYDRYYAAVDRLGARMNARDPLRSRGASRLDGQSLGGFIDRLDLLPAARFLVEASETAEYATEPRNLSLLWVAQQSAVVKNVEDAAAETMRISGGNDRLPVAMAAALGVGSTWGRK